MNARDNPDVISDLQQTGLRRSEGMSGDERAFWMSSLSQDDFLEVHSQRQLGFCQNFLLRVVSYHQFFARHALA